MVQDGNLISNFFLTPERTLKQMGELKSRVYVTYSYEIMVNFLVTCYSRLYETVLLFSTCLLGVFTDGV